MKRWFISRAEANSVASAMENLPEFSTTGASLLKKLRRLFATKEGLILRLDVDDLENEILIELGTVNYGKLPD